MSTFFVEQDGGCFEASGEVNFMCRRDVRKVLLGEGGVFSSFFGGRWRKGPKWVEKLPPAPDPEKFAKAAIHMLTAEAPSLNDFGRMLGAGARCVITTCIFTDHRFSIFDGVVVRREPRHVCEMELVFWKGSKLGPLFSDPCFVDTAGAAKIEAEEELIAVLKAALRELPQFSQFKEDADCENRTRVAFEKGLLKEETLLDFAKKTGAILNFEFRQIRQVWECNCGYASKIHKVAGTGSGSDKKAASSGARTIVAR